MSRADDLAHVGRQLQELEVAANEATQAWQQYHAEVTEAVKERLVAAGLWDEIHTMELEREETRKKVETKLQDHRQKHADLIKVRDFLTAREAEEKIPDTAVPTSPVSTEAIVEAPVPVPAPLETAPVEEISLAEEPEPEPEHLADVRSMTAPRSRPVAPKI